MNSTRRHFLATSALAGAFSLAPNRARAASANGDLRICVIGFNSRGKVLARQILKLPGANLVALCDADAAVIESFAAELEKDGVKPAKFTDYRKACEDPEIDAVVIATPNHLHTLIATTAAANGKHAYVEKPVSHNVREGRLLANAALKYNTIIQHGFQRRSEQAWVEAADFLQSGEIGKITLARGLCYKPRPSIGNVAEPVLPPATVDYNLWSGPRELLPVRREKFHYDWHWQFPYGNGDLGNQGPHQLDVCRMMIGDPILPPAAISVGARLGYKDNGDWANTQICYYDYPIPILFEVRGLPTDPHRGLTIGNIIECEGGYLAGGHEPECHVFNSDGKKIKTFRSTEKHMETFIASCHSGKIDRSHGAASGHLSSALAHIGNISWLLGETTSPELIRSTFENSQISDAISRMLDHLEKNNVDPGKDLLTLGKHLTIDPEKEVFTGEHASLANPLLTGSYREGFTIPV